MAKNKNKNKNKNSNQGNKNVESRSKVVTDLTQEQVDKIDKFLEEEMPTEAIELSDEELVETKEDAQKIEEKTEEEQLAAVEIDGRAIQHILNPSEKVQLEAVKENGFAIHYIHNLFEAN